MATNQNGFELQITAKNLCQAAFDQAAAQLQALGAQTTTTTGNMGIGFTAAGESAGGFATSAETAAESAGGFATAAGTAAESAGAAAGEVENLGGVFGQLQGVLGDAGEEALGYFAAFATGAAVFEGVKEAISSTVEFISSSVEAFSEAQQAETKLGVALQTQGLAIPGLKEQYEQLGESYETTTAFSHTALEGAEALFVQLGNVGPDMMDKALQAATDLSAGLGIALPQAVELLSRAAEGQTASFSRYGIVLDQAQVKAQGFGYVLDAVEAKVGGQAQAQLDTYAGQVAKLGNEWDDVKEKVGAVIVQDPLLQGGLLALSEALDQVAHSSDAAWPSLSHLVDLVNNNNSTGMFASLMAGWVGATQEEQKYVAAFADLQKRIDQFNQQQATNAAYEAQGKSPLYTVADEFGPGFADDNAKALDAINAAAKAFRQAVDSMESAIDNSTVTDKVKALTAAVKEMGGVWGLSTPEFTRAADEADKLQKSGANLTGTLAVLASMASDRVTVGIKNINELLPNTQVAVDNLTKGATAFADTIAGVMSPALIQQVNDLDAAVSELGGEGNLGGGAFLRAADAAEQLRAAGAALTPQLAILAGMDYTTGLGDLDKMLPGTALNLKTLFQLPVEKSTDDLKLLKQGLDTLASAIGGDIGAAIKSFGELSGSIDTASKDFSAAFGKNGAFAQGDMLGGIEATVGGISSIAGAAVTAGKAVMALWNDVFGTAGRDAVEQFASTFQGGFAGLQQQLNLLGAQGQQLWIQLTQGTGRNDATQAAANIKAVQDALSSYFATQNTNIGTMITEIQGFGGSIDPALDPYIQKLQQAGELTSANATALQQLEGNGVPPLTTLESLQSKYNLTLAQMGPSFDSQEIDKNFQGIIDDMNTLTRGGVNVTAAMFSVGSDGAQALSGLGTAIQGDIQDAINAGVAIPANLKDAATALINQGDLLDANGKKITDVSQLTFGATLQDSLDTLNDTLTNLIKTLTGNNGLEDAINQVGNMNVSPTIKVNTDWSSLTNGPDAAGGVVAHASGAYIREDHVAQVHSGEIIGPMDFMTRALTGALSSSGVAASITAGGFQVSPVMMDGQKVADLIVRRIPNSVQRFGVRTGGS